MVAVPANRVELDVERLRTALSRSAVLPAGRELGLLALVAAGTQVSTAWIEPTQPVVQWLGESIWKWILVGCALALTALRRWVPGLAVLGAAAQFGLLPASATALAVTSYGATFRIKTRSHRLAVLLLAPPTAVTVAVFVSDVPWRAALLFHSLAGLICVGLPATTRVVVAQVDRLVRMLRERAHYLEENVRLAGSAARLQERSRIAEEMHDQLGHRLSLISLHAGALELIASGFEDQAHEGARLIRSTAQTAMQELRMSLGLLRQAPTGSGSRLCPVNAVGTRSDIARLVDQSRAAGITVELDWSAGDVDEVPLPVRQAVHRVVREGLTNVHRHAAGSCSTVTVVRRSDWLHVRVTNGPSPGRSVGAGMPGTGMGLIGVRERVRLLDGRLTAGPADLGGFELAAALPIRAEPPHLAGTTDRSRPAVSHRRARRRAPAPDPQKRLDRVERWSTAGLAAVLASGLAGIGALVVVIMISTPLPVQPGHSAFGAVYVGMPEHDARKLIGGGSPVAAFAARAIEPPRPAEARCLYKTGFDPSGQHIRRYCFRGGRLIAKTEFHVPGS